MSESQAQVKQQNHLLAAVDELFANTQSTVTLRSGQVVQIYPAKVKHLRSIVDYVSEFVGGFQESELVQLIAKVSKRQEQAIDAGESPYTLDTESIVKEVAGEADLIMRLVQSGVEALPKYVTLFSDMTVEQFEDLELDEAAVIGFAIFGRNYHFFTQQALPVILGSIGRLRAMTSQSPKNSAQEKK